MVRVCMYWCKYWSTCIVVCALSLEKFYVFCVIVLT